MKKGLIFRLGYDIISHADKTWPFGQAAKTSPSHGENGGSIPPRVTKAPKALVFGALLFTSSLFTLTSYLNFPLGLWK